MLGGAHRPPEQAWPESVGESEGSSADPPSLWPQVGPVPATHMLSLSLSPFKATLVPPTGRSTL